MRPNSSKKWPRAAYNSSRPAYNVFIIEDKGAKNMAEKKQGKGKKEHSREKQLAVELIKQGELTYKEIHSELAGSVPGFDKSVSWVKNVGFELRNRGSRKAIGV